MKTRTVVLEIEIEGSHADALRLRDAIERTFAKGERWQVTRAEVLEERQP